MTEKPRIRVTTDGRIKGQVRTAGGARRDAARYDIHELAGWNPGVGWGGFDGVGDTNLVLGRARDLDNNNPWINAGLDRRVEAVIGNNIQLSAQPLFDLLNRDIDWRIKWASDVESRYRAWANDIDRRCDTRRKLTIGQIARLAYLGYVRDGEAAAEIRNDVTRQPNPTNVLLIDPERISHPQDKGQVESSRLRGGIQFDENGAATGYWVRSRHPNDPHVDAESFRWDFIPATGPTGRARMLHVFNPRRAEQLRGISRLAEAMVPAKMVDRADRAELAAALKSAVFSFFIKSAGTTDDLAAALAPAGNERDGLGWMEDYIGYRKANPVRVDGADVFQLFPGEDVITPERNSPNGNYKEFVRLFLQKIAGSVGVSYQQMSQDWESINYSSARTLLNEMWRSFLQDRTFFCQQFLSPIYAAWLEMEVANGTVKVPGGPMNFYRNKTAICMCDWIGPGRGSIDPQKEANAANLDTAAGRTSAIEQIRERGLNPNDVLADEATYLKLRGSMGLPPVNNNLKGTAAGGAEDSAGTEDDRDADGIPNEGRRPRRPQGDGEEA